MVARADQIMEDVLGLPNDLRAKITGRLLESLAVPIEDDVEALWVKEAEKRLRDVEQGRVRTVPGDEVFASLRRKPKRR